MSDITVFRADRAVYWRAHAWLAAIAMAAGMAVLWAMGNPHVWTGAIGGLAAVALRGFYLASEEATAEWELSETHLTGPGNLRIALADLAQIRGLGSAVQLITRAGDKHLMKYMPDRTSITAQIRAAAAKAGASGI